MDRTICHAWQQWDGDKITFSCECGGEGCPVRPEPPCQGPDNDPAAEARRRPCDRWPTCEGYLDDPHNPYPGDCTWPACKTPPTPEGSP